jgi:hypothetical protein
MRDTTFLSYFSLSHLNDMGLYADMFPPICPVCGAKILYSSHEEILPAAFGEAEQSFSLVHGISQCNHNVVVKESLKETGRGRYVNFSDWKSDFYLSRIKTEAYTNAGKVYAMPVSRMGWLFSVIEDAILSEKRYCESVVSMFPNGWLWIDANMVKYSCGGKYARICRRIEYRLSNNAAKHGGTIK